MENYFFLENYVTSEGAVSEGAVSHNVLPFPITRYQMRFNDDNNCFEKLPIVSTAKYQKKIITVNKLTW